MNRSEELLNLLPKHECSEETSESVESTFKKHGWEKSGKTKKGHHKWTHKKHPGHHHVHVHNKSESDEKVEDKGVIEYTINDKKVKDIHPDDLDKHLASIAK